MDTNTLRVKKIKVGDLVNWRGSFGFDVQRHARVTSIELCPSGGKYGVDVPEIEAIHKDSCVFDLDNGHWAYGKQIELVEANQ